MFSILDMKAPDDPNSIVSKAQFAAVFSQSMQGVFNTGN